MTDVTKRIIAEANRAHRQYGPMASTHEAYGVLMEEVAELLEAIRQNTVVAIRNEAVQVAAVALRLAEACQKAQEESDEGRLSEFSLRSGLEKLSD